MNQMMTADTKVQQDAAALRDRVNIVDHDTLALLLTEARSHKGWRDKTVSDDQLCEVYEVAKMGPTSLNQQPMRLVLVRDEQAKDKLADALIEPNIAKMRGAPVTAIIAYDMAFHTRLPEVFPHNPGAKAMFENNEIAATTNAFRNSTLQGAYFMIAARAVGLDIGPMSGFDNGKVDEAFFSGTTLKSNFLCSLGYADESKVFRRRPRLDFHKRLRRSLNGRIGSGCHLTLQSEISWQIQTG